MRGRGARDVTVSVRKRRWLYHQRLVARRRMQQYRWQVTLLGTPFHIKDICPRLPRRAARRGGRRSYQLTMRPGSSNAAAAAVATPWLHPSWWTPAAVQARRARRRRVKRAYARAHRWCFRAPGVNRGWTRAVRSGLQALPKNSGGAASACLRTAAQSGAVLTWRALLYRQRRLAQCYRRIAAAFQAKYKTPCPVRP